MITVRVHSVMIIFVDTNADFDVKITESFNGNRGTPRWIHIRGGTFRACLNL